MLSEYSLKIVKTCNLYLCFISMGMCLTVPGPCLLDLKDLVNTDTQHIALIYTSRSVSFLFGSIIGGLLLDAVKCKDAFMTFFSFINAIFILAIPWSTSIGMLHVFVIASNVSLGVMQIGCNVSCLTIWGTKNGPFLHALHFMYGLGGLVAPLIAAPFLGNHNSAASSKSFNQTLYSLNSTSAFNFTSAVSDTDNNESYRNISRIVYPFLIIGLFSTLATVVFLVICIISPKEGNDPLFKNEQSSEHKLGFITLILMINCFLIFVESGIEIGYTQLLTTYVVQKHADLTASIGSFMTSAFMTSYTVLRMAAVFIAIKFSHFRMIIGNLIVISAGGLLLLFFATHEWSLWVSSVLLGAGTASFYPAAIGWFNAYITVTNKMTTAFGLGLAFGDFAIPVTISYFIETIPDVLIYVVLSSSILMSLLVLILFLLLRKLQKRSE